MNKAKLLLIVNTLAFIALLVLAITGIMIWLKAGNVFKIHLYASLAFIAIVLIHIILNFSWIKNTIKNLF